MVEQVGLAGPVVLQRFRDPGLDLGDPGLRRRVGREEFGLARAPLRGHAHPQIARGLRMIAGARHVDQAEVVGLRFLQPAPRQEHSDRRAGAEASCWLMRSPPWRAIACETSWPSTAARPASSRVIGRIPV